MKFSSWLLKQRNREDAIGDLARDAYDDPELPKAFTADYLRDYLTGLNRVQENVFDAVEQAEAQYNALQ